MTQAAAIRSVIILGGGTAGWIAASALARVFQRRILITLVESPDLPIVGVGEATIPPILDFISFLGIDEQDFVRATHGTYKVGIAFQDWSQPGSRYWHPFGTFGGTINGRPFQHYWHRARRAGRHCSVQDYSLAASLGEQGRFLHPHHDLDPLHAGFRYALHFDAMLVGQYLRRSAESLGVRRVTATVVGSTVAANGHIRDVVLADGTRMAADFFIDCSGVRGALIGGALAVPYQDWRHWLPCDRAVAVPGPVLQRRPPYTLAVAHTAGWRWQIPLQHRTGNGVIYSSRWMADETAEHLLLDSIDGAALDQPRRLRFTTGRREVFWSANCVAFGLASGFLEPLESTSIQLVINGIYKLLDHFPDMAFGQYNIAAYNRAMTSEFDAVRDFIILHYCLSHRRDSGFWRYCAEMELPSSLAERIALYRETGRVVPRPFEMFTDLSWFYVLDGMGVEPVASDPIASLPSTQDLFDVMEQVRRSVARIVRDAPEHDSFFAPTEAKVG